MNQGSEHAVKTSEVRGMRRAKRESLRLLDAFVQHSACDDAPRQVVATQFMPGMLKPILTDYCRKGAEGKRHSDCRDASVHYDQTLGSELVFAAYSRARKASPT